MTSPAYEFSQSPDTCLPSLFIKLTLHQMPAITLLPVSEADLVTFEGEMAEEWTRETLPLGLDQGSVAPSTSGRHSG
jgi:hypothetical protein